MSFAELLEHIKNLPPPTDEQIREFRKMIRISDYQEYIGRAYTDFIKFMYQERIEYNLASVDGRAVTDGRPCGLQVHIVFDKIEAFDWNLDWYKERE